ncbi:MAG TPA: lipopolysaccharide biosynthesis protein [Gemmatimonadales bacterium]|nr:lipopolysaccharide biosynthesis protein [Gemmatimonadales bacterium]
MKGALGLLGRDAVVYGLAGGVSRFVKVLLVPIVAKAFPAETYGVFDALGVYTYLLAALGVLGLDSVVVLFAGQGRAGGTEDRGAAATQALLLTAGTSALLALAVIVGSEAWSALLLDSRAFGSAVAWAGATVPFSSLLIFALSLLKWEFRRGWYLVASLGSVVVSIGLTYLVAFHTAYGLPGLFAASLAGQAVGAGVALWGCRDLFARPGPARLARRMVAIGIPFALIATAGAFTPSIDRFFVVRFASLESAGLYGVGQKIAALTALVLSGFQAAWGPFAVGMRDAAGRDRLFSRVLLLVAVWGVCLVTLLSLAAPTLAAVLATPMYAAGADVVPPLALAAVLTTVYFVVSIGSFLEGRSLRNLGAYAAGIAVTIALNAALATAGTSPVAIAWANCAGQAVAVVFMAALSHRVHPIAFPFTATAVVLAAGAGLASLAAAAGRSLPRPLVALALPGTVIAFGLVTWFAILQPAERRAIRGFRRPA